MRVLSSGVRPEAEGPPSIVATIEFGGGEWVLFNHDNRLGGLYVSEIDGDYYVMKVNCMQEKEDIDINGKSMSIGVSSAKVIGKIDNYSEDMIIVGKEVRMIIDHDTVLVGHLISGFIEGLTDETPRPACSCGRVPWVEYPEYKVCPYCMDIKR